MINLNQKPISDENELAFAIFCIENVALKLGVSADKVYHALADGSGILNGYDTFMFSIMTKLL